MKSVIDGIDRVGWFILHNRKDYSVAQKRNKVEGFADPRRFPWQ